ncbi:MAG TPA: flagella basal body P-ring formation protein FlgA [Acidobacteriaceae bacterium]|nr:flagella basal body P-ring formation protein FlgA [Acidobacteriaceae bacterium]
MKRHTRWSHILFAASLAATSGVAFAQDAACTAGYRVVARRYDVELRKIWEMRQDCLHPEWPAHAIAIALNTPLPVAITPQRLPATASVVPPILVHAGEPVRLWSQDASSRIEITGTAEQSARLGERIHVRIAHQTEDSGLTVQHIPGIVRAADDVEIAQ